CVALGFDALLLRSGADVPGPVPGIAVLAELCLHLFDGSDPLPQAQPECFRPLRDRVDRLPDPRHPDAPPAQALARFDDPACADILLEAWCQRLDAAFANGLSGVVCQAPQALSAAQWRELIARCRAAHPSACFIAWTPGVPAAAVEALADAGFDAAVSSLPWWDFRAAWLFEEDARLRRIGAVIVPVEDPRAVGQEDRDDEALAPAAACRMALAAAIGDGVLVPLRAGDLSSSGDSPRGMALHGANTAPATGPRRPRRLRPLWRGAGPGLALLLEDATTGADA